MRLSLVETTMVLCAQLANTVLFGRPIVKMVTGTLLQYRVRTLVCTFLLIELGNGELVLLPCGRRHLIAHVSAFNGWLRQIG